MRAGALGHPGCCTPEALTWTPRHAGCARAGGPAAKRMAHGSAVHSSGSGPGRKDARAAHSKQMETHVMAVAGLEPPRGAGGGESTQPAWRVRSAWAQRRRPGSIMLAAAPITYMMSRAPRWVRPLGLIAVGRPASDPPGDCVGPAAVFRHAAPMHLAGYLTAVCSCMCSVTCGCACQAAWRRIPSHPHARPQVAQTHPTPVS
jgi:hypothetical protein